MKKTLLMASLVVGGLWVGDAVVSAQETKTNSAPVAAMPPQRNGLESLGLTPEQKTKVVPIVLEMRKQVNEVRTNTAVAPADKQLKIKEIRSATNAKLKDLLTPEQLAKWERQNSGPRPLEGAKRPVVPAAPKN